jgi:FkbM family methyltransferase
MTCYIPKDQLTEHAQKEFEEGYRHGRFDKAIKHVNSFRRAVDIGAHIGSWTVLMAERFDKVIALEPNPNNFIHLRHNLNINGFINVTALPFAANDTKKKLFMIEPKKPISAQIAERGDIEVDAINLDFLELEEVDFIKVHCNGHEVQALNGAIETIKRNKPVLFVTVKVNKYIPDDHTKSVLEIIEKLNYVQVWHSSPDYVFCPS